MSGASSSSVQCTYGTCSHIYLSAACNFARVSLHAACVSSATMASGRCHLGASVACGESLTGIATHVHGLNQSRPCTVIPCTQATMQCKVCLPSCVICTGLASASRHAGRQPGPQPQQCPTPVLTTTRHAVSRQPPDRDVAAQRRESEHGHAVVVVQVEHREDGKAREEGRAAERAHHRVQPRLRLCGAGVTVEVTQSNAVAWDVCMLVHGGCRACTTTSGSHGRHLPLSAPGTRTQPRASRAWCKSRMTAGQLVDDRDHLSLPAPVLRVHQHACMAAVLSKGGRGAAQATRKLAQLRTRGHLGTAGGRSSQGRPRSGQMRPPPRRCPPASGAPRR